MAPPTIDQFLNVFRTFHSAPEELAGRICTASNYLAFSSGDMLYHEGDACPGIALFLDGEVRVYKVSESGREITLYEIGPGETCVLNASCILAEQQYPAHAAAITAGSLLMLPSAVFQTLMVEYPEMRHFIYGFFSQRLANIMTLVEEIAFGRLDERLLDYLLEKSSDNVLIATHQQIANELGSSREVVSRLLKEFERQDRVRLSRNRIELVEGFGDQL